MHRAQCQRDSCRHVVYDDVVAHGEPKPGAFAGGLGGEERIEHFFLNLWWDADAVVADADLHVLTVATRAGGEFWFEASARLGRPFAQGIKAIGNQVK